MAKTPWAKASPCPRNSAISSRKTSYDAEQMNCAIIVAGGSGTRMGSHTPKQYLPLAGKPIMRHTLEVFCASSLIHSIYLVVPSSDADLCAKEIVRPLKSRKTISVVAGGDKRQDSVFNGLKAVGEGTELAVIHDGVRPFLSQQLLSRCVLGAQDHGACIAALPASETLKSGDGSGCVLGTMDRRHVYSAQTPQVFSFKQILYAHERAYSDGFYGTDDAMLMERLGMKVKIVLGSPFNIKITTPEDLRLSEAIISSGVLDDPDTAAEGQS